MDENNMDFSINGLSKKIKIRCRHGEYQDVGSVRQYFVLVVF